MEEKRRFTRVALKTRAAVTGASSKVEGEVENLSLSGVYVRTPGRLAVGEDVHVAMLLSGPSTELSVELAATVVRQDDDGFGLRFDTQKFSFDAFVHLRNVIAYQRDDDEETAREFKALLAAQAESDSF